MKRKLIQLSPSTAVVSMPSSWMKNNKLKKGDEVEVQEIENAIYIATSSKRTNQSITIDLKNLEEDMAFTHCDAAYIAGYDEITFLIKEQQFHEVIQYVAQEVPGMIITNQTPTQVTFKDITGEHTEDIDALINRILNMSIAMLTDSLEATKQKDWQTLTAMKQRDHILNSYVSYAQRLINKYGYSKFSKTGLVITYLKVIEMLSDELAFMMKYSGKEKINLTKEFDQLTSIYRHIHKTHLNYSQKRIVELDELKNKLSTTSKFKQQIESIKSLLYNLIEIEVQLQL